MYDMSIAYLIDNLSPVQIWVWVKFSLYFNRNDKIYHSFICDEIKDVLNISDDEYSEIIGKLHENGIIHFIFENNQSIMVLSRKLSTN